MNYISQFTNIVNKYSWFNFLNYFNKFSFVKKSIKILNNIQTYLLKFKFYKFILNIFEGKLKFYLLWFFSFILFVLIFLFFLDNKNFLLFLTVFSPFFFAIIILFINKNNIILLKLLSLLGSLFSFIFSLFLWIGYDVFNTSFQYTIYFNWFSFSNINYNLGIDGISILFIILTTFLVPLCILSSWKSVYFKVKEYFFLLLIIEFFLLNIFCVLDLFFFYVFFESILIPMFLLIGIWGSRERKIHAAYQFFIYTLLGSVLMLLGILLVAFHVGTTDIQIILNSTFTESRQIVLWLCFFVSFAVKVPMFPVHIWLPEAHVEAPTAGSVLLAGVLLKLGTYGIFRFLIPVFSYGTYYFLPFVYTLSIIGLFYGCFTTIRQIDLKKIVAYSSVVHMNFALVGLFTFNLQSLGGSLFLMLSHGLVSGGLFLCVGVLYDRYHTRLLKYYSGLALFMPNFALFFLVLTLANIGFPGTSSFLGEFLLIIGVMQFNFLSSVFISTSMVLGAVYGIWLYNRVMFGYTTYKFFYRFKDLTKREIFLFFPLISLVITSGLYSNSYFGVFNMSLFNLIEFVNYY